MMKAESREDKGRKCDDEDEDKRFMGGGKCNVLYSILCWV